MKPRLSSDRETIIIKVPMNFQRHGSRKLIITPDGSLPSIQKKSNRDTALIRAIARAYRWQQQLEQGKYSSLVVLSEEEKINASYLSRILRLTLLAPDIIQSILDGQQPRTISLANLMKPFPNTWHKQREQFGFNTLSIG
jgi:hypothetical protein